MDEIPLYVRLANMESSISKRPSSESKNRTDVEPESDVSREGSMMIHYRFMIDLIPVFGT